jgi:hypothetical protein
MGVIHNVYYQNVMSTAITFAIAVVAGTLYYYFSRRRRLLRFFGCSGSRRIRLYLSNLDIVRGGAKDPSGLMRSYHGSSTPGYELRFIPAIFQLFLAPVPGLSDQLGWLRFLALREVEIDAAPSPKSVQDIDASATIITVGSAGYNTVSGEVETNFEPRVLVDPDGYVVAPDGTRHVGLEYAVLAKCRHPSRLQWAFYAAGPTRVGTTSAFLYLIQNWSSLSKEFGDQSPFSVTIRVIDGDPSRREVVHRYPTFNSPVPSQ